MIPRLLLLGGALQPPSQPAPGVWHSTEATPGSQPGGFSESQVATSEVYTAQEALGLTFSGKSTWKMVSGVGLAYPKTYFFASVRRCAEKLATRVVKETSF